MTTRAKLLLSGFAAALTTAALVAAPALVTTIAGIAAIPVD